MYRKLAPLVSVIIPCYNAERFVEKAVRSIMEQTYHNLEIICCDDCSSDSTLTILEKLCDDQSISILKDEFAKRKIEIKITDTVQPYNIVSSCREYEVEKKLHEFQRARLVVTDRLHGMIFSTITGTPCIALNNSSGKVEGVWSLWLQKFSYIRFANNCEEAKNAIDELLVLGEQDYNPSVFDTYWQQLADVVSGNK